MSEKKICWGILGTADIARKNWLAIRNSGNGTVRAVASRDLARASEFIQRCQGDAPMAAIPGAFSSYEELLRCKEIDAVYIPLPTGLRKEWALRAASAGKHVVGEKPCAANLSELVEMMEACRRHRVQFMDGVMFMHSTRLDQLRQVLEDPDQFGAPRRITSAFTFCAPPDFFTGNIRARPELEPHGCLGDLGWYCIRFALWTMNWQMPREITGSILSQAAPPHHAGKVITEFSGELVFDDGVSAGFFCSFLAQNQEWAHISGTKAYIRVEDFVVPFAGDKIGFEVHKHDFVKSGCEFRMERSVRSYQLPEHSQAHPTAQETNLFRAFARQVLSGQLNEDWPRFAVQTQTVMEACLQSARTGAPVDLRRAENH